ncbi:hypothetical protein SLS62_009683 [Diatrype stigma]|uniref:L-arabinitol 4-dehydrogenase n=1 Tax=Diatrype stigma TaxID=117547 RepID=A0AAN9UDE3_9PEZI
MTINGTISNGNASAILNGVTAAVTNGHTNGHAKEHTDAEAYGFKNPSLYVDPEHKLTMVDGPIEEPGPGEVTLQIKCSGICGIGSMEVKGQCILGHEAAGVVLKCGEGVTNLKIGDRVGVEPQEPCEKCFLCREGRYNLCEDVKFSGIWPYAGTIQRYKVHPAKWLYKIPDALTYQEGALLEPLSVILHGIKGANVKLGQPTLICGAGPIGLVALAAARASGAHPLVITDVNAERLAFAKSFVPRCETYLIKPKLSPQETAAEIRQIFNEGDEAHDEYKMPASVMECTGVEGSVCTACYCVRRGGTLMVVGVGKSIMNNVPFMHLSLAEIDLKFINRYRDTWPAAIQCMKGGIVDLNAMVTHKIPLERAVEAFELQTDPTKFSIKIHITDDTEALVEPAVPA